jgi:hypothetical protein
MEERTLITDVHLAHADANMAKQLWDVQCLNGRVLGIAPSNAESKLPVVADHCSVIEGGGGVLLPS